MKKVVLTQTAYDKLLADLNELKSKRSIIVERIETAQAHGDLRENFDYHDAKEEQGMNEARIRELEELIKNSEIVESGSSSVIGLGSDVDVEINGIVKHFKIVSFNEASPADGLISNESPIGESLMGHKEGDEFNIDVPAGKMKYKIISVT